MINNNIWTFLAFQLFLFGYFLHLVFRAIFFKFGQNSGFVKYQKEKVKKPKTLKCYYLSYGRPPHKKFNHFTFYGHFWHFLAFFFYPISLDKLATSPKTQPPQLPETRFWLVLVNNQLCGIPTSWATPDINIMVGESCELNSRKGWELLNRILIFNLIFHHVIMTSSQDTNTIDISTWWCLKISIHIYRHFWKYSLLDAYSSL